MRIHCPTPLSTSKVVALCGNGGIDYGEDCDCGTAGAAADPGLLLRNLNQVTIRGIYIGLYRDNGKENGSYHLGFRV